jgi:hypothetical protein
LHSFCILLHLRIDYVHLCGRMQHGIIMRHSFDRTFSWRDTRPQLKCFENLFWLRHT